jgi:hypothetical protein
LFYLTINITFTRISYNFKLEEKLEVSLTKLSRAELEPVKLSNRA